MDFRIVQGRVVRVAPTERYLYLNFGADWRTDFTVRRSARNSTSACAFGTARPRRPMVEVRGYVLEAGGPLIEVSHPEQIQVLP